MILKKVILPVIGMSKDGTNDQRIAVLWDAFKAHSCPSVKEYCQSCDFLDPGIIIAGLTIKAQLLDRVVNKFFIRHLPG